MAEEKEKSKAKWAAEAYAFLALFRRLQRRLPGLLMLEFGWGLLIRLVAPLAGENAKTAAVSTSSSHGTEGISAFEVFLIGALAIAVYWLFASGIWKIPYLWVARPIRPLTSIALVIALIFVGILTLPLLLLAILVDRAHLHFWLKKIDPNKLAKIRADVAEKELREIHKKETKSSDKTPTSFEDWKITKGSTWIANEQAKIAKPTLTSVFEKETKWRLRRPWEGCATLVNEWRLRLDSLALIGLAPFHSYSFEEEQKSAKAPLQIFATAIRRLRLGLYDPMIVSHVRFMTVPEIVAIESEDAARRWRAWLGLDTLLWGSYASTSPTRIWLNVENKRQRNDAEKGSFDREERIDWAPLRTEKVDFAMMEVDQDDQIECYLVVLLCFLRILQRRPEPSGLVAWKQDVLRWKKLSGERTFLRLVRPLLPKLKQLPETNRLDCSPAHLLVTYISNWATHEIRWFQRSAELRPVSDMLRHCARLEPTCAEHEYRLGAALCLLNNEHGARAAFAKAQALDRHVEFHSPEEITSFASIYLEMAYRGVTASPGESAAAVAFVARAMKLGGPDAAASITENLVKTEFWQHQVSLAEIGIEPSWSTTDLVLCSLLGLDRSSPTPKAPQPAVEL